MLSSLVDFLDQHQHLKLAVACLLGLAPAALIAISVFQH